MGVRQGHRMSAAGETKITLSLGARLGLSARVVGGCGLAVERSSCGRRPRNGGGVW